MENKRVMRTRMLLGNDGISKLEKSCVMIVGVGAVGGQCLEALARAGIGNFMLVDFDSFEESNVNRQILAVTETLGQKKVEVAKKRVLSINPSAKVRTLDCFVNEKTISELIALKPDMVVDAIDALNPKCELIRALVEQGVPFVSSMGAALKTDPFKIKFGTLNNSKNCSLAKFVRKRLRKRGVDISKVKCVWSEEQIDLPETALILPEETAETGRTRHTMGSLPTITAIFGLILANQVILTLSEYKK